MSGPRVDWRRMGIDLARVKSIELLHKKHGNRLYRVQYGSQSYILKWFNDAAQEFERQSYALLQELGVPTLLVHGQTESALLLEDLLTSTTWRLATKRDVENSATGVAVAEWNRQLHEAGRELLSEANVVPGFLKREVDGLTAETIRDTAEKLGMSTVPVWALAAANIEALKHAMRSLSETLTYNDFHWTNLALSRHQEFPLSVVVFDYHFLGIGLRYSDYRNVSGSLGESAKAAFWEAFDPVVDRERIRAGPSPASLHSQSPQIDPNFQPEQGIA